MKQKSRIRTWESVNFNSLASSSAVPSISRVHLPECNTREPISFVGIALCKMPPFWRKCSIGTALWVWDWWIMGASCETSWIGIVVWMVWRSIARKHKHEALLDRGETRRKYELSFSIMGWMTWCTWWWTVSCTVMPLSMMVHSRSRSVEMSETLRRISDRLCTSYAYKVSNLFCKTLWGNDWLNVVLNVVNYGGLAQLPK